VSQLLKEPLPIRTDLAQGVRDLQFGQVVVMTLNAIILDEKRFGGGSCSNQVGTWVPRAFNATRSVLGDQFQAA